MAAMARAADAGSAKTTQPKPDDRPRSSAASEDETTAPNESKMSRTSSDVMDACRPPT
jgi:hypothetical protein